VTGPATTLLFGGDYNPEQWSREVWAEDVRLMHEAHVNTVTLGVFAWSSIEPREGQYTFGWLDDVMDLMAANQIGVILATPTASPPPWFTVAHPDGLPVTRDGVRLIHGSRDTYNPAAAAYREAARRVARALGERYSRHPALRMWHVHNEYGSVSYGPVTDAAFRTWLGDKYGDLDCLNRVWNTAFWSQGYAEWEEIFAPQATQYLPNPAQVLDFNRFTADTLRDCLREQIEILRGANPEIPVTTNFMLASWNHYDQWDFAAEIDQVSIDHYLNGEDVGGDIDAAFASDLARSFNGGRPWLLMEQATSLIYDYAGGRVLVKEPGRMLRNTLQYLARGSASSLFFQWRAPRTGAEFFHSAMVTHAGEDSRVFREIIALGDTVARLGELAAAPESGRVNVNRIAIVWDATAWWATQARGLPATTELDYPAAVRSVHAALWQLGFSVDVVDPNGQLNEYELILVPSMLPASDQQADRFDKFVRAGGHLAVWYFSGSMDENLSVRPGGYSGAFADTLGIRVQEIHPQRVDAQITLDDGSRASGWAEDVELRGATTVASYVGGVLDGSPAITRCERGDGVAHYLSTRLDAPSLSRHLCRIVSDAGIAKDHIDAGGGLETVRRFAGERSYLFAINHTAGPRQVRVSGDDLLTGTMVSGRLILEAGGSAVVREDAPGSATPFVS
jgi:beta-galactosidase